MESCKRAVEKNEGFHGWVVENSINVEGKRQNLN